MQEYYKSTMPNDEYTDNKIDELNAQTARIMTNNTIINLVKKQVFPKIAEKAQQGESSYSFEIKKTIDYQICIDYLKKLGYYVNVNYGVNIVQVTLKW